MREHYWTDKDKYIKVTKTVLPSLLHGGGQWRPRSHHSPVLLVGPLAKDTWTSHVRGKNQRDWFTLLDARLHEDGKVNAMVPGSQGIKVEVHFLLVVILCAAASVCWTAGDMPKLWLQAFLQNIKVEVAFTSQRLLFPQRRRSLTQCCKLTVTFFLTEHNWGLEMCCPFANIFTS